MLRINQFIKKGSMEKFIGLTQSVSNTIIG